MSKNIPYVQLKEICTVNQGLQIPIEQRFKEDGENRYFYITVQFLKEGFKDKYYIENPPTSSICNEYDILVVRTGNTGQIITGVKGCFHNNFFKINYDKQKIDGRYLYYCLSTKEKYNEMLKRAGVTTIPDLNHFMFLDMKIPLLDIEVQRSISKVLDAITNKIELNNKIKKELETMSKTIYDYWFNQFDFPDKNGNPYKSFEGKMVYNEELKKEIPDNWGIVPLEKIIEIHDSKRIPLSNAQREKIHGIYPYYGATSIMDYVNDYIFDGTYILIAEDGSVMDDKGKPVLQYIWGKSWVNNHAHVLEATNGYSNELLHLLLQDIQVVQIMTGSIQKKINQENLREIKVISIPDNLKKQFNIVIKPLYEKMKLAYEENKELTNLKNFLLPMLMNGQITFKEAEALVEEKVK